MATIKDVETDGVLYVTLTNLHVSEVNAIRRTILSDIPVVVIRTENSKINQCNITINTTRFHNEIVKQRLSCIPIHTKDIQHFPEKYILEIDVKNEKEDEMRWVTTQDFKVKDKKTNAYIETPFFPPNQLMRYIDFLRLRPKMSQMVPAEHIQLTAEFSVSTAKENGMFNVVSLCTFENIIDEEKKEVAWHHQENSLRKERENITPEEMAFEKKNFQFLDAHRCYKTDKDGEANAFLLKIKTIGVYTNYEILETALDILVRKCEKWIQNIDTQMVPMMRSSETKERGYTSVTWTTMDNSWDIILENEDYTFGCLLERVLYTDFFLVAESKMSFVGFKKYHPHDSYSVIRIAYKNDTDSLKLREHLKNAGVKCMGKMMALKKHKK